MVRFLIDLANCLHFLLFKTVSRHFKTKGGSKTRKISVYDVERFPNVEMTNYFIPTCHVYECISFRYPWKYGQGLRYLDFVTNFGWSDDTFRRILLKRIGADAKQTSILIRDDKNENNVWLHFDDKQIFIICCCTSCISHGYRQYGIVRLIWVSFIFSHKYLGIFEVR